MAYGTLQTDVINSSTGLFSTNNAYLGVAKAWAVYNGVTQTIVSSFNISSVTYNSTGSYTFTFTTAMPNANYSVSASCGSNSSSTGAGNVHVWYNTTTGGKLTASASTCTVGIVNEQGTAVIDTQDCHIHIIGA